MGWPIMTPFTFDAITLHWYTIPLLYPFRISAGEITEKNGLLVEVRSGDVTGWGEASVDKVPFYAHETVGSAADVIQNALGPLVLGRTFRHPDEVTDRMTAFRGARFAKAALDAAAWDIAGKLENRPVWRMLGGTRETVEVGPSVGIKHEPAETVAAVGKLLADGDCRIKIKVSPGRDLAYLRAVREAFPGIRLMADANSAYRFEDAPALAAWDAFRLLMIEQPLDESDIYFHSRLRSLIHSPVCLDESMHTLWDAQVCAELGGADIVNIKVCRVGGLTNARRMHDLCALAHIPNWIGSRVGSSVGDGARLAAATLPNCSYPSDCVISSMYMSDDLVTERFPVAGYRIAAPEKPGLGFAVDREKLRRYAPNALTVGH